LNECLISNISGEEQTSGQTTSQDQSVASDSSDEDDEDMAFPDTQVNQPAAGGSQWDKYNLQTLGEDEDAFDQEGASQQEIDTVSELLVLGCMFHLSDTYKFTSFLSRYLEKVIYHCQAAANDEKG
jgi:hypothetical protein